MAFKVLTQEQIALLTQNQKKQYERELEIYNERVAFVERIKVLENAEIPTYEPKLQKIEVISEIPEKEFVKSEYTAKMNTPVKKTMPKYNAPKAVESIEIILPKNKKISCVEVSRIKKTDPPQSNLPKVEKVKPIVKVFKDIEDSSPVLPGVIKPKIKSDVVSASSKKIEQAKAENVPKVVIPSVPETCFASPQNTKLALPKALVGFVKVREFEKIENNELRLPEVVKANIAVKPKKVKQVQAVIPELSNIEMAKVEFKKPSISNKKLPDIKKTNITVHKIIPVEHSVSKLIEVTKPEINFVAFEKQAYKKTDLPKVKKIDIREGNLKVAEIPKVTPVIVPIPEIIVKSFVKPESKVEGIPDKTVVKIPDAYEKLKELLTVKDISQSLEESNS